MGRSRVHLIAVATSAAQRLGALGMGDVRSFRGWVARLLGERYRVTADLTCLRAKEDEYRGGRTDDVRRARDLQEALADDETAAIVALCGGAWFTRVLHRIDFGVLDHRRTSVRVFGSSEMTSLVNIVARYKRGQGIHDVMPLFILDKARPKRRASQAFDAYWSDVDRMISGQGSTRPLRGELLSGTLPRRSTIRVVGGNLTLVASLLGGPFAGAVRTRGRWLALEDVNEKPERIDRMLAQLRLAGMLDAVEGLLLGDFHRGRDDLHDAVAALLRFHLPNRRIPVVGRCNFGHVWPSAPLPLNQPSEMVRRGRDVHIPYTMNA